MSEVLKIGRSHHNISNQMNQCIIKSFKPGISKRQDKINGNFYEKTKVYSYTEKESLIDIAKDFSNWLKNEHKEIRKMKDITPSIVNEYLSSKTKTCTTKTIQLYATRLDKIGKLGESIYGCKMNIKATTIPKGKEHSIRTVTMSEKDYQKIISVKSTSLALIGVKLSHAFRLRVSECVRIKPEHISKDSLTIYKSKGGKTRVIPIETKEQQKIIKEIKTIIKEKNISSNKFILNIKADSINKWLARRENKLNMTKYRESKTSIHSIRKNYAQREYDRQMKLTNGNEKESYNQMMLRLGHGKDRLDLREAYLGHK